jgi:cell division protein DivIC
MRKLRTLLKNKYLLILSLFLMWMIFFDQDNIPRQFILTQEQKAAEAEQEFLRSEFLKDSLLNHQLENDPVMMEKFARENYLMKKDDETIFLVVEDEK